MIYAGLAGLVITNLIFGIRYFTKVYFKLSAKRQKFIEINQKDWRGRTALMLASEKGHAEIVKMLEAKVKETHD